MKSDTTDEADGTNRPIEFSVYDNLGEATAQEMFTGDGVAVTTTDGVVNAPDASLLRAETTNGFDDQGNVYQSSTFSVDPTDGTVGDAVTTNTFLDLRGDVIATYTPGQPTEKSASDGAGRDVEDFATDGGAVNNDGTPLMDYPDAASITNDVVVSDTQHVYDNDGDEIETVQSDLLPDASAPAPTPTPTIGDAGFEYPDTYGGYSYDPSTDSSNPWTFSGDSGVTGNGSGFTYANPDAPEGAQVAFVQQSSGDISQSLTFAAGTYVLKFSAAQRSGNSQDFEVLLDSGVIDTVTSAGSAYAGYTVTFTVAAGSHTLEFQGLDTAGGDNTAFIDNIRIQLPVTPGTYRTSYVANYFDDANRPTASENVGTYGGVAWTRPGTPDASDATHLVSSMTYNSQGLEATSTDPRGIVNATFYNLLGETTKTIAAYTDGTPTADTNQTTEFTYNGGGNETSQTAVMPTGTPSQTTAWVYGVTTGGGSTIDSNDLLAKEEFPDATTGDAGTSASDNVEYDDDNLGGTIGMTDQNGTTHSYGLDLLGRETSDSVIVLGSGVDGSVRLHTMNYDEQGNVYQMTAYADTGGMTLVNQVQDMYNGLGQLTGEYQADSGAVDTGTTPETQYAYSDPTSGSLMTSMTYPNGRILHYGRDDNALDTAIGRVDYLADDDGSGGVGPHLVDYLYMGLGTTVQQADANGDELTYLQQSGDESAITSGDQYAGDEVTGLDRFGQVIDQNWVNTTTPTPTTTDRSQYNYDQDGNVLYSDNLLNAGESELYHSNSTSSGDDNSAYDPLARLTDFERGTLSASGNNGGVLDTIASPTDTQDFALDAVGNQTAVTTDGTTVDNTANAKNELTTNGSSGLVFDNNGNTLTDESGNVYTFDAWNHVETAADSGDATIATYTYAANGKRITETGGGVTSDFYFNGQQIIEQRQAGTVTDQYVYNIDFVNDVLLRDDNSTSGNLGISGSGLGQRLFPQHDANFDETALTNTSGVVVQRAVYSPYGTMTVLSPSWTSTSDAYSFHPGFQGMWQDLATGLYYTPNRDYDPATGTWREQDPAGYVDGSSVYQLEDSNPAERADPSGLETAATGQFGLVVPPLSNYQTAFSPVADSFNSTSSPYVNFTVGAMSEVELNRVKTNGTSEVDKIKVVVHMRCDNQTWTVTGADILLIGHTDLATAASIRQIWTNAGRPRDAAWIDGQVAAAAAQEAKWRSEVISGFDPIAADAIEYLRKIPDSDSFSFMAKEIDFRVGSSIIGAFAAYYRTLKEQDAQLFVNAHLKPPAVPSDAQIIEKLQPKLDLVKQIDNLPAATQPATTNE